MTAFGTFFLPGPTEVRPEILDAMTRPLIGHRGAEFEELFARIQDGLRYVFRTTRPVFVATSSATGMMEAGVRCAPEGKILCLVNGAFSERFARIAENCGREFDRYDVAAGEAHDPAELGRRLDAGVYSAMTVVHSETSTSALNDVPALITAARAKGAATIVDSVSGIGGVPFETDNWAPDFLLSGSQKALALPPGLAFATATEAVVAGARNQKSRGVYLDVAEFADFAAKNQTPNTPAVSLFFALDAQLADIRRETVERRWERHAAMQRRCEEWVSDVSGRRGWEVRIPVPLERRSPTVTLLELPKRVGGDDLVAAVARRGFTIGPGYRALGGSTVRIGHMGDHTVAGLERCLATCEDALAELLG